MQAFGREGKRDFLSLISKITQLIDCMWPVLLVDNRHHATLLIVCTLDLMKQSVPQNNDMMQARACNYISPVDAMLKKSFLYSFHGVINSL